MANLNKLFTLSGLALCVGSALSVAAQDLSLAARLTGYKFPNSASEGRVPVVTHALPFRWPEARSGFNELVPFVLRSPDQEDAGSCLYMSLTGVAEFWMARLNPSLSRVPNGPIDLSERYFMNLAGSSPATANWLTDSILHLNKQQKFVRNADYRYTKGWYKSGANGYVPAVANEAGASYGPTFNWIDQLSAITATPVKLPKFERNVLFADPARNQWNVGIAPDDIIQKVKDALVANKAPVQVVYNHYGYWHSVFIVGFDDSQDNGNCSFVEGFLKHLQTQIVELNVEMRNATTPAQRQNLEFRIANMQHTLEKAGASYKEAGGCHPKGVFYVRDSIYSDANGPIYDYDPSRTGEETPYTQSIVLHEYDWVQHMANNVVQIIAK